MQPYHNAAEGPSGTSRPYGAARNEMSAEGARLSTFSTLAYKSPRVNRCTANGDTCNGYRIKGFDLCAGHRNAVKAVEGR